MTKQHLKMFSGQNVFAIFSCLCLLFSGNTVFAQGNLLVSPKRLVFDGSKKTQELNLANTGRDTATYLISIKEIRMTENGSFEEILQPDPGQNFSSKNLRFYPRTIVLAPNEAQTVKVQMIKASELQAGEYRSHIYFRAMPKEKPLGETSNTKVDSGISVQLTPVFGITIPAIIRIGESNTKVTLSDLSFNIIGDTMPRIGMTLNRTGNMSAYGDIVIKHISASGKETDIGSAMGVAIYTPNSTRKFQFDLPNAKDVDLHSGKIKAQYVLQPSDKAIKANDPKSAIIAETEMSLK